MPKISVLIPTYNRADFLKKAIMSIRFPSHLSVEIIVVDDGSTDNTREIINGISESIRYVYQDNRGVSCARNLAFRISRGRYIVMLDSDDEFLPNALERLSSILDNRRDVDFVYGDGWICDKEGRITGKWSEYWQEPFDTLLENVVVHNCLPLIRSAMIRRSLLEQTEGPFDEEMIGYEDWDLAIRLAGMGCRVFHIDEPISKYRIHEGSKSLPNSVYAARRHQSLIKSRIKVVKAPWFDTMSNEAKYEFFQDILLNVLRQDYDGREELLTHDTFKKLPAEERGRLLYQVALQNLFHGEGCKHQRKKIIEAIKLYPGYPNPYFLYLLSLFGPRFTKTVIHYKRSMIYAERNKQVDAVSIALDGH